MHVSELVVLLSGLALWVGCDLVKRCVAKLVVPFEALRTDSKYQIEFDNVLSPLCSWDAG